MASISFLFLMYSTHPFGFIAFIMIDFFLYSVLWWNAFRKIHHEKRMMATTNVIKRNVKNERFQLATQNLCEWIKKNYRTKRSIFIIVVVFFFYLNDLLNKIGSAFMNDELLYEYRFIAYINEGTRISKFKMAFSFFSFSLNKAQALSVWYGGIYKCNILQIMVE